MASVERFSRSGGVRWVARWRDLDGAQRKRTFLRKVDAERWLVGVEGRILDGSYIDPGRARVTVGVWAEQWMAGQAQLKASSRARYAGLLRTHVLPAWGPVPLAKVTHAGVAGWVSELAASGLSASTVQLTHRVEPHPRPRGQGRASSPQRRSPGASPPAPPPAEAVPNSRPGHCTRRRVRPVSPRRGTAGPHGAAVRGVGGSEGRSGGHAAPAPGGCGERL